MRPTDERINEALTAGAEELWRLIRDGQPDVLLRAIENRHFSEEMAVFAARRRNMPREGLGILASDHRFRGNYQLKLHLCRNPKTPQRVVFSLLKFIHIFDLSDISGDRNLPVAVRQRVEGMITERLRGMAPGIMKSLARRASPPVLMAIMERGDVAVITVCLESPSLTEGILGRIINRPSTSAAVIRQIAGHGKWRLRYFIRYALIRNFHTPMTHVVKFIVAMKTSDLKDLYADPIVPSATRPFIFRELRDRGEGPDHQPEETYSLHEEDDTHITGAGDDV